MLAATRVLRTSPGGMAAFAVFVITLCALTAPRAQVLGSLTGTVTDSQKAPLPGVKVTLVTTNMERTAVTGLDGSYQFPRLPPGSYTAKAELAGFETAVEDRVVVAPGVATALHFALEMGCLQEAVRVDMGFARSLRDAAAVVHIRITSSGSAGRCPVTGFCVCTEHAAHVIQVVKAGQRALAGTTIRFLQEGAGRIAETGQAGAETPYPPGQEYVAFLRWDSATDRFLRFNGHIYMFPVRDNRVEFRRTDAAGLSDGMRIDTFIPVLRTLASATR